MRITVTLETLLHAGNTLTYKQQQLKAKMIRLGRTQMSVRP